MLQKHTTGRLLDLIKRAYPLESVLISLSMFFGGSSERMAYMNGRGCQTASETRHWTSVDHDCDMYVINHKGFRVSTMDERL